MSQIINRHDFTFEKISKPDRIDVGPVAHCAAAPAGRIGLFGSFVDGCTVSQNLSVKAGMTLSGRDFCSVASIVAPFIGLPLSECSTSWSRPIRWRRQALPIKAAACCADSL